LAELFTSKVAEGNVKGGDYVTLRSQ